MLSGNHGARSADRSNGMNPAVIPVAALCSCVLQCFRSTGSSQAPKKVRTNTNIARFNESNLLGFDPCVVSPYVNGG